MQRSHCQSFLPTQYLLMTRIGDKSLRSLRMRMNPGMLEMRTRILSPTIAQLHCQAADRKGHLMSMNLVARDMTRRKSSHGNFQGRLVIISISSVVSLISQDWQTRNVRGLNDVRAPIQVWMAFHIVMIHLRVDPDASSSVQRLSKLWSKIFFAVIRRLHWFLQLKNLTNEWRCRSLNVHYISGAETLHHTFTLSIVFSQVHVYYSNRLNDMIVW